MRSSGDRNLEQRYVAAQVPQGVPSASYAATTNVTPAGRHRWFLILLAAAVAIVVLVSIRQSHDRAQTTGAAPNARSDAIQASAAAPAHVTASDAGSMPRAVRDESISSPADPPPASTGQASVASKRTIDVVVTAPLQAIHGSTFEVSVGLPPGTPVQSAKFRVKFEPESLEVLDIIDAVGTRLTTVPSASDTIELDFDIRQGAIRPPAIEFVARADKPHQVLLSVAAELRDAAGRALEATPSLPYPIMLVP